MKQRSVPDNLRTEILAIRQSGLVLSGWYVPQHEEIAPGEDGVAHFCETGWRKGARPNPYFDPGWYLAHNPEIASAGVNPLLHYIAFGEAEGRDPSPYFSVRWYRETYALGPNEPCLKHYLDRRVTGQVNPVPVFDAAYYLENNPDVAAGGADPFEHFLIFGIAEARDPAADFDMRFYMNRYSGALRGENPLLHYIAHRESGMFLAQRPEQEGMAASAVRRAARPSPHFEEFRPVPTQARRKAKLLAYYLPQFHRVPENDAWWGKGFTDWTNLGRASPRFAGHLQPRIPRDLGYYTLDDPGILRRQIELAKGAGLSGFVYYAYWFNRHRLLEKPLEQLLGDATLDFPFCVMWANENWTRRWDGLEREVLIAQEYREHDDAALVECFARMFADKRYIRINGRPLFMIYRVTIIPDATRRIAKWRELFRTLHGEDPLIVMAQSLGDVDPKPYGLDGAVEFPPHKLSQKTPRINEGLDLLDPDFCATVHDYAGIAETSLKLPAPEYPLIKTIVPGWDNDPRREGKGLVLHGATPEKYQAWLENLIDYTSDHPFCGERLICVNAWNEWAEGAFLEPDMHFGAAFLNATGRAICERDTAEFAAGILLVGHDAQPHGAQLLLLHLARKLKRQWGLKVHLLLLGVGPLLGQYYEAAEVSVAYDKTIIGNLLDKYRAMGIRTAIVNTAAAARMIPWAEARGIRTTLLVHEMPQLLKEMNLEIQARLGAKAATNVVFSSNFVRDRFFAAVDLPAAKDVILPQGNYQEMRFDKDARARIRRELGVGDDAFLILGAGFADFRKGFDLFVQMARKAPAEVHFAWVGSLHFTLKTYLAPELAQLEATGSFHLIPFTDKVADYFSATDVFALTSREDPYPTVVMEALACGIPCVAFDGAGGIPQLLRDENAGRIAKLGDADDFLAQIAVLLDHEKLEARRAGLSAMAAARFDFSEYAGKLLQRAQPSLKKISVAVLNYNYARYLPERLGSVFSQNYPVAEVLLLDDASADDFLKVADEIAAASKREMRVIANAKNSGSVFAQWKRAAEAAQGEFIWLCEADDAASPDFLSRLMEAMAGAENPLLAFTDSRAVDADGRQIMRSYQSYYFESGVKALAASGIWEAGSLARTILAERNLILNVSAVLWRRKALIEALASVPDIAEWRVAGDWRLYLALLTGQKGSVVYIAEPLNTHRRHDSGVTQSLDAEAHVKEIAMMQEIAAKALKLDKAARKRQAAYLEQVTRQLKPAGMLARKRRK